MKRNHVNKRYSAKQFRRDVISTKKVNVGPPPMRGGYRM